jgi:lipid II:glycine glycyltransferase (peptidoglycan interpeptide bridge formation enzyme)
VTPQLKSNEWNTFLEAHPDAHILQTSKWGELKTDYGWEAKWLANDRSGAQVLLRNLPLGLRLAYIPKGPIGNWLPTLLPQLDELCRQHRVFALKIEPDDSSDSKLIEIIQSHGFLRSHQSVQPRRTLVVDLQPDEEQILSRMHQKTRYNIRLAMRKGVSIRPWTDPDAFGRMVQKTAARDAFGAHVPDYYRMAYDLFHPDGSCEIFLAEVEGQSVAALMVFARGKRAWYFYGASTTLHRNLMPNYLLQWEAMRWARNRGCTQYDMWGVPDQDFKTLEAQFTSRRDGLWGVYRFKRGFRGQLIRSAGAWDRPYNRFLYTLYSLMTRFMHNL